MGGAVRSTSTYVFVHIYICIYIGVHYTLHDTYNYAAYTDIHIHLNMHTCR